MGSWSIAIDTPPNVVSIGPYYNGKRHLKQMQALKRIALSHFIKRTNKPIECYTSKLKLIKHVDQLKASYKYLDLAAWQDNDDKFIEMMMLDGCFILEFLDIADKFPYYYSDPMFSYHVFVLNYDLVMEDLLMENNQLPYMVLETLWSIGFPDNAKHGGGFLSKMMSVNKYPDPCFDQVLQYMKAAMEQYALEGKRRICCASELYHSGARFEHASFPVTKFISGNGILKLPSMSVEISQMSMHSNIIQYEQTVEPIKKINLYMGILGALIQSTEDVRLLTSLGVLIDSFGSDEELVLTMKCLMRLIRLNPEDCFSYCSMLQQMHIFCERSANKWGTRFRFGRCDIQMKHYINHMTFFVLMVALVYSVVAAGAPGLMFAMLLYLMFLYVVYVKII